MSQDPNDKKPLTLDDMVARGAALRSGPEWAPSAELIGAVADIERADDLPAPDPVVMLPEKGGQVVVTEMEAAEAYVGPVVVRSGLSPRMPTGPVKIRSDVDPRRQPTLRRVPVPAGAGPSASYQPAVGAPDRGAAAAERGTETTGAASMAGAGPSTVDPEPARDPGGAEDANAAGGASRDEPIAPGTEAEMRAATTSVERHAMMGGAEPAPTRVEEPAATGGAGSAGAAGVPGVSLPSANVPSVRPANEGRGARRLLAMIVPAIVAGGVVTVLLLRAASPPRGVVTGEGGAAVRATAEHAGASADRPPSAATVSASCVNACPGGEMNAAATGGTGAAPNARAGTAPPASAAPAATATGTGTRAATAATEDPYIDASAPAASMKPTAAAPASAAPAAAPVVTAQPSAAPAATAAPSTTAPRPATPRKPAGGTKLDD